MIEERLFIDRAKYLLPGARAATLLLLAALSTGCDGLAGRTYTRQSDGSIGPTIANVALSFVKEDGTCACSTNSDASGRYSISLDPDRYYVLATHRDYQDDTSAPGFVVVGGNTRRTAHFFLREPQITTVLIVRHAEKLDPNSNAPNEPLSDDGGTRAGQLRDTLFRAGISAVYSTDMVRTRNTVAPLATPFRLPTQLYETPAALPRQVLAEHRGDVVLIAAHSDTVATVANAFGAQVPDAIISDFDNLYVVSVSDTASNVVNLQYAADSSPPPERTKNDRHAMTLLLVRASVGSSAQEAQELLHAASKAEVTTIYTSVKNNPLLAPLATALGLTPTNFNGSDMQAFASQLISTHAQDTLVIAGTHDELRELIRQMGGSPFPALYDTDVDHLIVVTRFASGVVRVVPMRL